MLLTYKFRSLARKFCARVIRVNCILIEIYDDDDDNNVSRMHVVRVGSIRRIIYYEHAIYYTKRYFDDGESSGNIVQLEITVVQPSRIISYFVSCFLFIFLLASNTV